MKNSRFNKHLRWRLRIDHVEQLVGGGGHSPDDQLAPIRRPNANGGQRANGGHIGVDLVAGQFVEMIGTAAQRGLWLHVERIGGL